MRLAPRIILVFLPIVVIPLAFLTYQSTRSAQEGIGEVATSLLRFKTEELLRFCDSQYRLLAENKLEESEEYLRVAESTIGEYARGLIRDRNELILAIAQNGEVVFDTTPDGLPESDRSVFYAAAEGREGWRDLRLASGDRVSFVAQYPPFGWTLFVSQLRTAFFAPVARIAVQSLFVGLLSLMATVLLVVLMANFITTPLSGMVKTMHAVVETGDLSQHVEMPYDDEIGVLGDAFNSMTGSLEQAYKEIKNFALEAAIAQKRETKIRNIFQKYVPRQVIDLFFNAPEAMLVGQERELAIMFSDIREFTAYSEQLSSRQVVEWLNDYFSLMVDVVEKHAGTVDKYIGDALMAFFGAPTRDEQSAYHAVSTAFGMLDELAEFNRDQSRLGRKPLKIGIGINYGPVTIGNIGSEKKMEYTVIGDMVNLASRLEGLTKFYRQPIMVSQRVRALVGSAFPFRLIDRVQVKGRTHGVDIFTTRRTLNSAEVSLWNAHAHAIGLYYNRRFAEAAEEFNRMLSDFPDDYIAEIFRTRAHAFDLLPPPDDWTGVIAHTEK